MSSDTTLNHEYAKPASRIETGSSTHSLDFFWWRVCAWAGPFWLVGLIFFVAVVAHFFPPPLEAWTTPQVVSFFTQNDTRIIIGMIGVLWVAPFYFVWACVVSKVMEYMVGPRSVLSNVQLMGGTLTAMVTQLIPLFWLGAAFRISTRTPNEIQMLYDIGWVVFNLTVVVSMLQYTALAIAILTDKRKVPLFPKWLPWLTFATEVAYCPALLMLFLPNSPFAWNGLLVYYISLGLFTVWQIAACCLVFPAITRIEAETRIA